MTDIRIGMNQQKQGDRQNGGNLDYNASCKDKQNTTNHQQQQKDKIKNNQQANKMLNLQSNSLITAAQSNQKEINFKSENPKQQKNPSAPTQSQSGSSFLLSFQQYLQNQFIVIQKQLKQMSKRLSRSQDNNSNHQRKIQLLQQENTSKQKMIKDMSERLVKLEKIGQQNRIQANICVQDTVAKEQNPNTNEMNPINKINLDINKIVLRNQIIKEPQNNQTNNITQTNKNQSNRIKQKIIGDLDKQNNNRIATLQWRICELQGKINRLGIGNQNQSRMVGNYQQLFQAKQEHFNNYAINRNSEDPKLEEKTNILPYHQQNSSEQPSVTKLHQKISKPPQINIASSIPASPTIQNFQQRSSIIMTNLIRQNESLNKKFYQVQISVDNLQDKIVKNLKSFKQCSQKYQDEVESLKYQVQDYKLKKQAKYLKMLAGNQANTSNNAINNSSNNNKPLRNSVPTSPANNHNQNTISSHSLNQPLQQYIQYLAQKVHHLSSVTKQLLPRQTYENQIQYIHQILISIRKRLADKIDYEQINKVNSVQDLKGMKKPIVIYKKNAKGEDQGIENDGLDLRKQNRNVQKGSMEKGTQRQGIKQLQKRHDINQQAQQNNLNQTKIQQIQRFATQHQLLNYPPTNQKKQSQKTSLNQHSSNLIHSLSLKISSHEQFMKQMNKFYNQKLNLIEISIQKIEKSSHSNNEHQLNRQKTNQQSKQRYNNYSDIQGMDQAGKSSQRNLHNSRHQNQVKMVDKQYMIRNHLDIKKLNLQQQSLIDQNPQKQQRQKILSFMPSLQQKNPQFSHNFQFSSIKKKLHKLNSKYDSVQRNIKIFKQQILKQMEIIHKDEENKTDWESFKKAIKYFDQKIKILEDTISVLFKAMKEEGTLLDGSMSNGNISGQLPQVAAKRKWSCLFCDKEMKNYQGKVSDIKYIRANPNHRYQSPRLGGYYKQSIKQKQYQKLYLNNNNNVSTNVRTFNRSLVRRSNTKNSIQKSKQMIKNLNEQENNQIHFMSDNVNYGQKLIGFQ